MIVLPGLLDCLIAPTYAALEEFSFRAITSKSLLLFDRLILDSRVVIRRLASSSFNLV
jgi:hypothetical protein